MNLFETLGERVAAECGARRGMIPRHLFYDADAPALLADALRRDTGGRTALVFGDVRTRAIAGDACLRALRDAGWTAQECVIPDGPGAAWPVCDDRTKDTLRARIPAANAFVAVGSGVVNDLTKWLAAEAGAPYAVLATAASMNGYSAANVAPTIRGVKCLLEGRAPLAIAADPRVIEAAPYALTSAGLGDVIAKPVSTADWFINHRLFGESFSPAIAGIIDAVEPRYLSAPDALKERSPAAVRALFEALVLSGCAMTLQGSSLPASGGEHLISHALDMMSHADGVPHDLHGRQVGVATIFAAALYQRALAVEGPAWTPDRVPFDRTVWGGAADAVATEHAKKLARTREACELLRAGDCWPALRKELIPLLRKPEAIKDCLRRAGAAHRVADLGCSTGRFLVAVQNCAGIRARFSSMDVFFAMGLLPADAGEIVEQWLL